MARVASKVTSRFTRRAVKLARVTVFAALVIGALPPAASAAVRTRGTDDPYNTPVSLDPNTKFVADLQHVQVSYDDAAGSITVAFTFFTPWNTEDSGGFNMSVVLDECRQVEGGPPQLTAQIHKVVSPNASPDHRISYFASAALEGVPGDVASATQVSADGKTFSASFSNALFASRAWRCVSSGTASDDAFASFFFDGYAPPPIPPPSTPCSAPPSEDEQMWKVDAPTEIAGGREVAFTLTSTRKGSSSRSFPENARATVSTVNGPSPTFTDQAPSGTEWTAYPTLADRSLRITATYESAQKDAEDTWYTCRRPATAATVKVIRGDPPSVRRVAGARFAFIEIPDTDQCPWIARAAVTVQVTSGRTTRTTTLTDPCGGRWKRPHVRSAGAWRMTSRIEGAAKSVEVRLLGFRSAFRTFTYRVKWRGRTLSRGSFYIARGFVPTKRAWLGSDDFFNYCVQEGRRIWRESGRYYCVLPGGGSTTVHFGRG